jgi:hypothetical protein
MEALEIADTAIKIGLGALISTGGTWLLAKVNHKSEKDKRRFERRLTKMEQAADEFDTYYDALARLVARLEGVRRTDGTGQLTASARDFAKEMDANLVAKRASLTKVICTLELLNMTATSKMAAEIQDIEFQTRNVAFFDRRVPEHGEIEAWKRKMSEIRQRFYSSLSGHYAGD